MSDISQRDRAPERNLAPEAGGNAKICICVLALLKVAVVYDDCNHIF